MTASTIPKTCNNEIQKIQRDLVWEDVDEKKFHAVKRETIIQPNEIGGSGLCYLSVMKMRRAL